MKHIISATLVTITIAFAFSCKSHDNINESFVEISNANPHYFQLSNGDCYIPIGCNIAAMDSRESMEKYLAELHKNGANYARVWLNSNLLEIEKEYGKIDTASVENIDRLIELSKKYGIKLKMCIESFRHIREGKNQWDTKASYHITNGGPFHNMTEYLETEKGHEEYIKRIMFFKNRYGDNPTIFGWELWNEVNAVEFNDISQIYLWTEKMLSETKRIFPRNLVMQSLGSYDCDWCIDTYNKINRLQKNEVAQIHRYIDEGAEYSICSSPIDVMSADGISILKAMNLTKPVLLAETGAVMPKHTGPHEIYKKDTIGVIFHDALFAPFFSGAAGPGHLWHWDHYIDKNNLWYHLHRFSNAINGFDPIKENPISKKSYNDNLRSYALIGNETVLIWCRDARNDWKTEFVDNITPSVRKGVTINLNELFEFKKIKSIRIYNPWNDTWNKIRPTSLIELPDFNRSVVIQIKYR